MVQINSSDKSIIESWIPNLYSGQRNILYHSDSCCDSMETAIKSNRIDDLIRLQSIKPEWNGKYKAHMLDFKVCVSYFFYCNENSCMY